METDKIFKEGMMNWNLGNPKEAGKNFEKVLSIDPNHEESLVRLGNVLGKIGKYQDAITFYDKALKLNSKNLLALVNKGLCFHYLKQYDDAIQCFDDVLEEKPKNTTAIYNKISSLIKKGEIKQGIDLLSELVKIDYSFKYKAKFDIDFQHIKTNNDFQKIVA